MGRLILLPLLLLLITCQPKPREVIVVKSDSLQIAFIKKAYTFQRKLDSLEHATTDSLLLEKIDYYKNKVDATIMGTINQKETLVKAYYFEEQVSNMEADIRGLSKELKEYQHRYELAIVSEEAIKNKLSNEVISHNQTRATRDQLQEEVKYASKLNAIITRVECINKNIWGNEEETKVASKVDYVNVYFTIPENKLAIKETKKVIVIMLSSDRKDSIERNTEIDYVGNQISSKLILNGKAFTPGPHQVTLYINGEPKPKITITLLKR